MFSHQWLNHGGDMAETTRAHIASAGLKAAASPPADVQPIDLLTASKATLKAGGIIGQRQPGLFTVRIRTVMGLLTAAHFRALAEAAERYGDGNLHISVRQSPEILGVAHENLVELSDRLGEAGLQTAICGPRVRAVAGCSGCTVNRLAVIDTRGLGVAIDERFVGLPTPAKFKVTIAGCPNDCVRAKGADLGFVGTLVPVVDHDECTTCGLCVATCRAAALSAGDDGTPIVDESRCAGCGACMRACRAAAIKATRSGLAVYAGGKHGRAPRAADHVADHVPLELAPEIVAATLDWYAARGTRGERLGLVFDRLGLGDYVSAVIPREFRVMPAREIGGREPPTSLV
jgi:anaerobic sulfite reductase subunit C